jgi:hypothetical protein
LYEIFGIHNPLPEAFLDGLADHILRAPAAAAEILYAYSQVNTSYVIGTRALREVSAAVLQRPDDARLLKAAIRLVDQLTATDRGTADAIIVSDLFIGALRAGREPMQDGYFVNELMQVCERVLRRCSSAEWTLLARCARLARYGGNMHDIGSACRLYACVTSFPNSCWEPQDVADMNAVIVVGMARNIFEPQQDVLSHMAFLVVENSKTCDAGICLPLLSNGDIWLPALRHCTTLLGRGVDARLLFDHCIRGAILHPTTWEHVACAFETEVMVKHWIAPHLKSIARIIGRMQDEPLAQLHRILVPCVTRVVRISMFPNLLRRLLTGPLHVAAFWVSHLADTPLTDSQGFTDTLVSLMARAETWRPAYIALSDAISLHGVGSPFHDTVNSKMRALTCDPSVTTRTRFLCMRIMCPGPHLEIATRALQVIRPEDNDGLVESIGGLLQDMVATRSGCDVLRTSKFLQNILSATIHNCEMREQVVRLVDAVSASSIDALKSILGQSMSTRTMQARARIISFYLDLQNTDDAQLLVFGDALRLCGMPVCAHTAKRPKDKRAKNCTICNNSLLSGTSMKLSCSHAFHRSCMFLWARATPLCPVCAH